MVEKPLTHWLFPDLPPKKVEEEKRFEGLNREDAKGAADAIHGFLRTDKFNPHLEMYEGVVGFTPPVCVSFTLTQPSVSSWSMPKDKVATNVEDLHDLVVGLWNRLTGKGMGICKIDIHPNYAPAVSHTPENITGWHVQVYPCWMREALPLSALHDEVWAVFQRLPSVSEVKHEKGEVKSGKLKLSWGKNPRGMWSLFQEFYEDSFLREKGYHEVGYDVREMIEKNVRDYIHEVIRDWREIRNIDLKVEPPIDIVLSEIPIELIKVKEQPKIFWHGAEYYAYGSVARPLDWLTIKDTIKSVSYTALVRLSRGVDYAGDEEYFNVLLSPMPFTAEEVKALELKPLEKMPRPFQVYISPKVYPFEKWYVLGTYHLKPHIFRLHYQIEGSWDVKDFDSYEEMHDFMLRGEAEIYVHAIRGVGRVSWKAVDIPMFKLKEGTKWTQFDKNYYELIQPLFVPEGLGMDREPQWIWKMSMWDSEKRKSKEIYATEKKLLKGHYSFPTES
jgi:hypothetical protein